MDAGATTRSRCIRLYKREEGIADDQTSFSSRRGWPICHPLGADYSVRVGRPWSFLGQQRYSTPHPDCQSSLMTVETPETKNKNGRKMYKENTSSVLQFGLIVSLRLVSICLFFIWRDVQTLQLFLNFKIKADESRKKRYPFKKIVIKCHFSFLNVSNRFLFLTISGHFSVWPSVDSIVSYWYASPLSLKLPPPPLNLRKVERPGSQATYPPPSPKKKKRKRNTLAKSGTICRLCFRDINHRCFSLNKKNSETSTRIEVIRRRKKAELFQKIRIRWHN